LLIRLEDVALIDYEKRGLASINYRSYQHISVEAWRINVVVEEDQLWRTGKEMISIQDSFLEECQAKNGGCSGCLISPLEVELPA